ncbi:hypothetical protein QTP88_008497 [Uroleucon formosanum]
MAELTATAAAAKRFKWCVSLNSDHGRVEGPGRGHAVLYCQVSANYPSGAQWSSKCDGSQVNAAKAVAARRFGLPAADGGPTAVNYTAADAAAETTDIEVLPV